MKTLSKKRFGFGIFASIALAALMVSSAQATLVSVEPPSQGALQGSLVEVMLQISGLGDGTAPSLGGFDLNVSYDPAVLAYNSVTFGTLLGPILGSSTGSVADPSSGTVNLFGVSLDTPADLDNTQPSQFVLASLQFQAINPGMSPLNLSALILADANGDPLAAETQGGQIDVTVVPEAGPIPTGIVLLGMMLAAMRRQRPQPAG